MSGLLLTVRSAVADGPGDALTALRLAAARRGESQVQSPDLQQPPAAIAEGDRERRGEPRAFELTGLHLADRNPAEHSGRLPRETGGQAHQDEFILPADAGSLVRDIAYYRCRFPAEYALADRVEHPLSVYAREDAVIGEADRWIAREFAPHRLNETIHDLAAAPLRQAATLTSEDEEIARKIAECDRKLVGYRATLDAGADPRIVAAWITETEAEKARYHLSALPVATARRLSEAEIKFIVDRLADIARVLIDADPEDKAEVFRRTGGVFAIVVTLPGAGPLRHHGQTPQVRRRPALTASLSGSSGSLTNRPSACRPRCPPGRAWRCGQPTRT